MLESAAKYMLPTVPFSNGAGRVVLDPTARDLVILTVCVDGEVSGWKLMVNKLMEVFEKAVQHGFRTWEQTADWIVKNTDDFPAHKIQMIKEFRAITGSGLRDAKDQIEAAMLRYDPVRHNIRIIIRDLMTEGMHGQTIDEVTEQVMRAFGQYR